MAAFPDLHYTLEDLIVTEDKIIGRLTYQATHTGTFLGIAPTGKRIIWTAISILRVANGQVVEDWNNSDALGIFLQIGTFPDIALLLPHPRSE